MSASDLALSLSRTIDTECLYRARLGVRDFALARATESRGELKENRSLFITIPFRSGELGRQWSMSLFARVIEGFGFGAGFWE